MIKIGLDIHGVVSSMPEFFAELTNVLVNSGNEVHILTGRTITPEFIEKINGYGIKYTHLFSIVDYHQKQNTPIHWADNDNPWIDDDTWNKTKAIYCKEHNIQLMLDDSLEYQKYFETPYALLLSSCLVKHKNIYDDKNVEKRTGAFTFIENGKKHTVYDNMTRYLYEVTYVKGEWVDYIFVEAVNTHDAEKIFQKNKAFRILEIKKVTKSDNNRDTLRRF